VDAEKEEGMIGMDFHELVALLILLHCLDGSSYWAIGGLECEGLGDTGTSWSIRRRIAIWKEQARITSVKTA
jgi:hypothetical protein